MKPKLLLLWLLMVILSIIGMIVFVDASKGSGRNWHEVSLISLSSLISIAVTAVSFNPSYYKLFLSTFFFKPKQEIRVSISYLYRICVKDSAGVPHYLLVPSGKIANSFQPVGGVYQYYDKGILNELGVRDDNRFHEKDDLRVCITRGKVVKLLQWFESGKRPFILYRPEKTLQLKNGRAYV